MKNILFDSLNSFDNNKIELEILLKERADSFDWKIAAEEYLKVYRKCLL